MTLLPPVLGASGGSMYSVMPPSQCKTPSNRLHNERKPLRDTLRAVSASPLTFESGAGATSTAVRPGNKRGSAGVSYVKKTVLLGGLLLLGGMAWRGGGAAIAAIRSRYQDEQETLPHGLFPDNARVGAFSPYSPPVGYSDSTLALLPLTSASVEQASAYAEVNQEAYPQAEGLSEAEHAALAAYLRQFQAAEGEYSDRITRSRRHTKNVSSSSFRFSLMYDRAKLPAADRPHLIAILNDEFSRFPQQDIKIRGPVYTWMVIDMLLLGMGEKETPFRLSYQKLGRAARRRLAKFSHIRNVQQYLDETPPHFSPRRKTAVAPSLMKKYALESRRHVIQQSAYWQEHAAGLNHVITNVYHKYYAQLAENFPPPALNQSHEVMVARRMLNGHAIYLPTHFTTREIYLGVPAREVLAQGEPSFYFPADTDPFVRLVCMSTPNIADHISRELGVLLSGLKGNTRFQRLFEATLDFRVIAIVIHALETGFVE